jgi:DNA-binding NtrC family response regulator
MSEQRHILIVDDDERVRSVLRQTLMVLNNRYQIVTARNGRDALRKAKAQDFDLVITDLRIPGMDGVELTEAIKAQNPETAVIWATVYDCRQLRADARRLSVNRCLQKPFTVTAIRKAVEDVLENGKAEHQ